MAMQGLALEQAPPLSVPLRFFLTAPLFALAAALVALWYGPDLFQSRWSPATLAVTHLLGLGCATMIMVGALLQILPVLAGATIAHPRAVGACVHAALVAGTLLLAAAFLTGAAPAFMAAAVLLATAFAVFVAAMASGLARASGGSATARMLQAVALALAVTVALGATLAAGRVVPILPPVPLADLHPGWALLGWVGLLVAAVAQKVVPMFQLTPEYPGAAHRLGAAVLALLAAWSVATLVRAEAVADAAALSLAAVYVVFALLTLRLQQRRRRRQFDVNLMFWRIGMLCAIAASLAWLGAARSSEPALELLTGVLALLGATLSVTTGMLYRIMPFLAWFHLYTRAGASPRIPHLKQYLAERRSRWQLALHLATIALAALATAWPQAAARAAAVALAASALLWLLNLLAIVRVYVRHAAMLAPVRAA